MESRRKDLLKEVMIAAVKLLSLHSCRDGGDGVILARAEKMLNTIWEYEFRQMKNAFSLPEQRHLVISVFWSSIHTDMECQHLVYNFLAIWDETANPPGQEGNVNIMLRPFGSMETINFKLRPAETSRAKPV